MESHGFSGNVKDCVQLVMGPELVLSCLPTRKTYHQCPQCLLAGIAHLCDVTANYILIKDE